MQTYLHNDQMEQIINAAISAFQAQGVRLSTDDMGVLDDLLSDFALEQVEVQLVDSDKENDSEN